MADLGRRMAQWTLRNNRRRRWRIYRKLQGMLNMNEALSRSLERLWYNYSEMGKSLTGPRRSPCRNGLAAIAPVIRFRMLCRAGCRWPSCT